MESPSQSPWSAIAQHSTSLLAVVYLFSAIAGTTYHYFLFDYFGVSVFDYWEASDFLASGVRNPRILVLAALAVLVAISIIWNEEFDAWAAERGPRTRLFFGNAWAERMGISMSNHPIAGSLLGLAFFGFFSFSLAEATGDRIASGEDHRIAIYPGPNNQSVIDAGLIGRTYSFVVAVSHETDAIYAIPIESIEVLQLCEAGGEACAQYQGAEALKGTGEPAIGEGAALNAGTPSTGEATDPAEAAASPVEAPSETDGE